MSNNNNISLLQRLAAAATHASWIISGLGAVWLPILLWIFFHGNAFVRPHAKQALAWQLFSIVYISVIGIAVVCAGLDDETTVIILGVSVIPSALFAFIGTIKALACEPYGYPLLKRLVECGI